MSSAFTNITELLKFYGFPLRFKKNNNDGYSICLNMSGFTPGSPSTKFYLFGYPFAVFVSNNSMGHALGVKILDSIDLPGDSSYSKVPDKLRMDNINYAMLKTSLNRYIMPYYMDENMSFNITKRIYFQGFPFLSTDEDVLCAFDPSLSVDEVKNIYIGNFPLTIARSQDKWYFCFRDYNL